VPNLASEARLVVLQADQRPLALHAFAMHHDLELALGDLALRIFALRLPRAAVPQLHGAAAILAGRNHAFEGAVFDGMIFDLDGEPLGRRIERRHLGDRPTLIDAVEFQPEVVMEPRRVMALDDEFALLFLAANDFTARFGCNLEVALLMIEVEFGHANLVEQDDCKFRR
jgi:hypothetical protein